MSAAAVAMPQQHNDTYTPCEAPPERDNAAATYTSAGPMEQQYTGSTGNDMGVSTMGFRAGKYSPPEWHESNYAKYYQAFADRDHAARVVHDSKMTEKETEATTNKTQADVTKKLGERLHDINFWKFELEREIQDVIAETDLLVEQKNRLDKALLATEVPLHIATDNLNCRQRRQGVDLVQDDPELSLLKEVEIINNVQDLLKKTIAETDNQIASNRAAKQKLEMDWSDKLEAKQTDEFCHRLNNNSSEIMFYPGAAKFEEAQSTPESWAQFSHDNIVAAEHERMASQQLRQMIDNIINDTSRDMREQADTVDMALNKRAEEMQEALQKLQDNLRRTVGSINEQERNIASLEKSIRDKEAPMKVAQTRLHARTYRQGVELCRDPAQYKLVGEVHEINQSIDALQQRLAQAKQSLKDLMDDRMMLEKEISVKKNSLFIEKQKVMNVRTRYPTTSKLQGYN